MLSLRYGPIPWARRRRRSAGSPRIHPGWSCSRPGSGAPESSICLSVIRCRGFADYVCRGGPLNRTELVAEIVADWPEPGEVLYIERRGENYLVKRIGDDGA